jgi:hypothetical protein
MHAALDIINSNASAFSDLITLGDTRATGVFSIQVQHPQRHARSQRNPGDLVQR